MRANRLRQSILKDFKLKGSDKDKRYSLTDKYLRDINFREYKAVVREINDDNTFPFKVNCTLINDAIKTQYQHYEAKHFEAVPTSKVLAYIDALRNHVAKLDNADDVSLSVYNKEIDNVNSHIIIDNLAGNKSLEIRVKNEFPKQ